MGPTICLLTSSAERTTRHSSFSVSRCGWLRSVLRRAACPDRHCSLHGSRSGYARGRVRQARRFHIEKARKIVLEEVTPVVRNAQLKVLQRLGDAERARRLHLLAQALDAVADTSRASSNRKTNLHQRSALQTPPIRRASHIAAHKNSADPLVKKPSDPTHEWFSALIYIYNYKIHAFWHTPCCC